MTVTKARAAGQYKRETGRGGLAVVYVDVLPAGVYFFFSRPSINTTPFKTGLFELFFACRPDFGITYRRGVSPAHGAHFSRWEKCVGVDGGSPHQASLPLPFPSPSSSAPGERVASVLPPFYFHFLLIRYGVMSPLPVRRYGGR